MCLHLILQILHTLFCITNNVLLKKKKWIELNINLIWSYYKFDL